MGGKKSAWLKSFEFTQFMRVIKHGNLCKHRKSPIPDVTTGAFVNEAMMNESPKVPADF